MAKTMLNQGLTEINRQINPNHIYDTITKLKALLELGLNLEFGCHQNLCLHGYLWVLSDLVGELEEALV